MAGGRYKPPIGGLEVPHTRTIPDIIIRTIAIHAFAALAYGHLLHLLGWKRPHNGPLKMSSFLVLAFLAFPELVLFQLGFWGLPTLLLPQCRARAIARLTQQLPRELAGNSSGSGSGSGNGKGRISLLWILSRTVFVGLNALPLLASLAGYSTRLRMRYHMATYVGNLGLDHRNGWLSLGALVALALSALVLGILFLAVLRSDDDGGTDVDAEDGSAAASAKTSTGGGGGGAAAAAVVVGGSSGHDDAEKSVDPSGADFDWSSFSEALYAAAVHQFLLGRINHPVPVIAFLTSWPLLLLAAALAWFLLRRRGYRLELVGKWFAMALVVGTIASQLGWDLWELWDVAHGRVEEYNYRWKVRDYFSARSGDT